MAKYYIIEVEGIPGQNVRKAFVSRLDWDHPDSELEVEQGDIKLIAHGSYNTFRDASKAVRAKWIIDKRHIRLASSFLICRDKTAQANPSKKEKK